MSKDLYKILGIPPTASKQDIRVAYRTLAKRYHPDAGAGSSEDRFREIQDAYETLSDPGRRTAYDRSSLPHGTGVSRHSVYPITPLRKRQPHDPSHLDLRGIFARHQTGPAGSSHGTAAGRGFVPFETLDEWDDEVVLRLLQLLRW